MIHKTDIYIYKMNAISVRKIHCVVEMFLVPLGSALYER